MSNSPMNIVCPTPCKRTREESQILDRHVAVPVGEGVEMELPPGQGELQNALRPGKNGGKESRARQSKIQTALPERAGQWTPKWVVVALTLKHFIHL